LLSMVSIAIQRLWSDGRVFKMNLSKKPVSVHQTRLMA
jgi:hypothetical protein